MIYQKPYKAHKAPMTRLLMMLSLLMGSCFHLLAQQMVPHDIPSPNAASLGKFGDIPMSYYTGTPEISIPLYTLSVRGVDMPISLVYDASGLRMNVLPSWTGSNWTLRVGGVITRAINGRPDEFIFPDEVCNSSFNPLSYFECKDLLPQADLNDADDIATLKYLVWSKQYDMEPDIFTFSFMGKTGKFFLGNDGEWKVYSEDNLDVILDVSNSDNLISSPFEYYPYDNGQHLHRQPKVIKGFKLRDNQGTIYEFGCYTDQEGHTCGEEAIEYTIPFLKMGIEDRLQSWFATSWYLTRVSDRLGNVLYTLDYNRSKFVAQFYNLWENNIALDHISFGMHTEYTVGGSRSNSYFPFSGQLDLPSYLYQISASDGQTVKFDSYECPYTIKDFYQNLGFGNEGGVGTDDYNLYMSLLAAQDSIGYDAQGNYPFYYLQHDDYEGTTYQRYTTNMNGHASDLLGKCCINVLENIMITTDDDIVPPVEYTFTYTYDNRMLLTEVSKSDIDGTCLKYTMSYNNPAFLPKSHVTRAVDHWGYYNGHEYANTANGIYSGRGANSTTMLYGMLDHIVYPTGGVSAFHYEPNDYSRCVSDDRQSIESLSGIGGGLRVRRITEYEDETRKKILRRRTFEYKIPGTDVSAQRGLSVAGRSVKLS